MGKFILCLVVLELGLHTRTAQATVNNGTPCQCSRIQRFHGTEDGCDCYHSHSITDFGVRNYTLSELPSNMTDLSFGDFALASWVHGSCPTRSMLRLNDVPRLSNTTTRLEIVHFCGFDFDNDRAAEIGSWLGDKKTQLHTLEIQCGTMRTLGRGTFSGYRNIRTLMIYRTGLEHIEVGAFSQMGFDHRFSFYMSFNNLTTFDWAVLKHIAPHLWTIKLEGNGMHSMRVTREVSFPALKYVDLTGNPLESIPQPVLDVWSESINMEINLKGIPLCSQDALCRCCSLAALRKFVTDSDSRVEVTCGDISNGRAVNGTSLLQMSGENAGSSLCVKDYFVKDNLGNIGNATSYDQCAGNDDEMACKLK